MLKDNLVDLLIVATLAWYVYQGIRRGLIVLAIEFGGFVIGLLGALALYDLVAGLITEYFNVARPFAKPIGFFVAWIAVEYIYNLIASRLYRKIPARIRQAKVNHWLGVFPALLDGGLLIAVILSLVVALPMPAPIKKNVLDSRIGGTIVKGTERMDKAMDAVFGGAAKETLTFLTIRQGSSDSVDLRFTTSDFAPDPDSERRMLDLVNEERAKQGRKPLKLDPTMTAVARKHSADMLRRGYFSHVSPEGKTPADRAEAGGVRYRVIGENLAYAPDVAVAHAGLMNSPGHRANILEARYGRIGIGIQNAGIYGIMVTQLFAN